MNVKPKSRGVLTIATGNVEYHEMAISLAVSLKRFSPGILRAIVTDNPEKMQQWFDYVIPVDWTRGKSFLQKLYIDQYTPFDQTLFVDCDCLVFRDIAYAFHAFEGGKSIISTDVYELSARHPRDWDFQQLFDRTGIDWVYGFNGGAYYVERGTHSEEIFREARRIAPQHQDFGIPVFRDGEPNDEYVLAAAMAVLKSPLMPLWHQLLQIPLGLEGRFQLDAARGTAVFRIFGRLCNPAIVHFCGYFRLWPQYTRECLKLRAMHGARFPILAARFAALKFQTLFLLAPVARRLWSLMPRPLRLAWHGVKSRVFT